MTLTLALCAAAAFGGYALSIFTWPWLRTTALGLEAEIAQLKTRAAALEAKLKALGDNL